MPKHVNPSLNFAAGQLVALALGDSGSIWIKLLPAGTFTALDGRGPFRTGDQAAMQKIIDRTLERAGSTELMIDYDHQLLYGPVQGVGGTARAAGWIKELQARPDGIFARVEFTPKATQMIRDGEYRYVSPLFASTDKQKGDILALFNAALVNRPALDMPAIAAAFSQTQEEPMEKILKSLGLKDGASEDAIVAAIGGLVAVQTAALAALGLEATAKPEDVAGGITALAAEHGKFADAVGLKPDAKAEEIVAAASTAVASAKSNDKPDPAKFVPIEQVTALRDELKGLRAEVDGEKATAAVDKAIVDGKLVPAMRDWGLDLFKSDRQAFEKFVDGAPSLTAAQRRPATPPQAQEVTAASLTPDQRNLATALGLSAEAYAKTLQEERNQEALH
ncbi:MAG: hypothetical protein GC202_14225 [Alphaproteobacteria bacterium]|nr:hypothetical protein [Alphaproteobacteria bacterium]